MKVIKTQSVPRNSSKISVEDVLAEFCFYFPQYKFSEARLMPIKRIRQMLKIARRERSKFYYEFTQIVAAPHTKKGMGYKKILEKYAREIRL